MKFPRIMKPLIIGAAGGVTIAAALILNPIREPQPMKVSYVVDAYVSSVQDAANPYHRSDDFLFQNIPDYKFGEPQKTLEVAHGDFFYAQCDSRMVFGKEKIDFGFTPLSEGLSVANYTIVGPANGKGNVYLRTEDKTYLLDYEQYENHEISGIRLTVGNRLVGLAGQSASGTTEIIRASQLPIGEVPVTCELTTKDGTRYIDTSFVRIVDDRT